MFIIQVESLYWADTASNWWTSDVSQAKRWADRKVPDTIIAYWNKVHYERPQKIAGKDVTVYSAIGGIKVLNNASVIEV